MMHASSTGTAIAAHMTDSRRRLLACLIAGSASVAWSAEPDPAGTAFDQLRAANAARSAEAREWQAWQIESERTYALLDAVQGQVARLRADATAAREAAAKVRQETEAAGETRRQLARLDTVFAAQADAIGQGLDHARAASVPGAVPTMGDGGDARTRFANAVRALETAERAAAATEVEVVEGDLEGQARAVTVLRIAGRGWWCEIDGARAGMIEPQAGRAKLVEVRDAAAAEAIRRAIAIAQGARPPELLLLPVPGSAIDQGAAK
jgi:hypothetical protein